MDNFYQQPRPFNPYQTQPYTPPYNGTIISVKGAEGCRCKCKAQCCKGSNNSMGKLGKRN